MSKEYQSESLSKEDFLNTVLKYNPHANTELIAKAYDFAEKAHKDQKRLDGRNHFLHCKEVAYMLIKLRLDTATISAGLLHDVVEDTPHTIEEIRKLFGPEVEYLVDSVTKTSNINIKSTEEERAENIRKIILATAKDIRVIFMKLADRLHSLRTLKYHRPENRTIISKETMEIYVPIAYKLGMYRIKSEMEDLCLRYMQPEVYQELKRKVAKKKEEREAEVKSIIAQVKQLLLHKGLKVTITGRAKNFYSIYKKMTKKGIPFDHIHDLSAIRVITDNSDDCYRILGIMHSTWKPLTKKFDDYIAMPKPNMYRSLHTEVIINGKPVEIQIRTWGMHHIAEEGIAAHWRYKETERDKQFDRRIAWLKQILEWRMSSSNATDFVESLKIDLFKDEIYTITPKGDLIPLPEKSTPVDFAYAVHTDIGDHCTRAKVNKEIAPLDHELKSGDVIEIITDKNAAPSRNWLKFVKTNLARSKIRQALGITGLETQPEEPKDEDSIIARIDHAKKSLLKLSKCCTPKYGDRIRGYNMKDGKIAVHREGCENLKQLDTKRTIQLSWKQEPKTNARIRIEVIDRSGLFQEILDVLTKNGIRIEAINTKTKKEKLYLLLEVKPVDIIPGVISSVKKIENVVGISVENPTA
ncbi:bifunctional (p)ppGpp synthetase/guanosine-3',5'-bis(diphosphate) 3'-pyrophosphohydrolase [Candidatus Woesearchaeota archaeon]|nr:bifunctional (p)ppGpp synthetase/guanosine-3',5'-bis(diphosphate) 3'-pyrophosphohydrolase [Candidatus Woesearchaeota archaeon]